LNKIIGGLRNPSTMNDVHRIYANLDKGLKE